MLNTGLMLYCWSWIGFVSGGLFFSFYNFLQHVFIKYPLCPSTEMSQELMRCSSRHSWGYQRRCGGWAPGKNRAGASQVPRHTTWEAEATDFWVRVQCDLQVNQQNSHSFLKPCLKKQNNKKQTKYRTWRDSAADKSTYCFSRGPRTDSELGSSPLSPTAAPGYAIRFWSPQGSGANMVHIHAGKTHTCIKLKQI